MGSLWLTELSIKDSFKRKVKNVIFTLGVFCSRYFFTCFRVCSFFASAQARLRAELKHISKRSEKKLTRIPLLAASEQGSNQQSTMLRRFLTDKARSDNLCLLHAFRVCWQGGIVAWHFFSFFNSLFLFIFAFALINGNSLFYLSFSFFNVCWKSIFYVGMRLFSTP